MPSTDICPVVLGSGYVISHHQIHTVRIAEGVTIPVHRNRLSVVEIA